MGYQKNAVLLVSVRGGYRPPSPQMVKLHRKSLRSSSKMGAGVATVPVRRAVPSRQIERGGGRVIPTIMFRDAERYIQRCESCQKFKAAQTKAAGKMLTRITSEPFDVLCADFVGPLPRSKHGNTMLLVFHDVFSKWVELIPCLVSEGVRLRTRKRKGKKNTRRKESPVGRK